MLSSYFLYKSSMCYGIILWENGALCGTIKAQKPTPRNRRWSGKDLYSPFSSSINCVSKDFLKLWISKAIIRPWPIKTEVQVSLYLPLVLPLLHVLNSRSRLKISSQSRQISSFLISMLLVFIWCWTGVWKLAIFTSYQNHFIISFIKKAKQHLLFVHI